MSITARQPAQEYTRVDRRAVVGGTIGMFVDNFDIYLPVFVLPAALGYFEPSSLPDSTRATLGSLVFTATLLARPLGSVFLGYFGDRLGRKHVAVISAIGFSVTTMAIALLPGYSTWGYYSIGTLICLRFIDGMFLAGGYAGPIPLALERSPASRRGLVAGAVAASAPLGVVVITLLDRLLTGNMSSSAFMAWGWRIPFAIGGFMGLAYLAYYLRVPELRSTFLAAEGRQARQPLKQLFAGANGLRFAQVLLITTGFSIALQMVVSYFPTLLITVLHQPAGNVNNFALFANIVTVFAAVLTGVLSQRFGRKPTLITFALWVITFGTVAYALTIHFAATGASPPAIYATAAIAFMPTAAVLGVILAYTNERFPLTMRSSGAATSFQFGLVVPALYTFWLWLLGHVMPYDYGAVVLVAIGGVLTLTGALIGPETKDVNLLRARGAS